MDTASIMSVGFERNRWLGARVAVIAANVANADTPGYKARDIAPFGATMSAVRIEQARTRPTHLALDDGRNGAFDTAPRTAATSKHSGNAVSLETEMASLGDARSEQAKVAGILGAFHRMLLASAKG